MKAGTEDKKKLAIAGVLGGGALIYLAFTLFGGSSTPPPAPVAQTVTVQNQPSAASSNSNTGARRPAPAARAAKQVATTSIQLDPTLHMEAMKAAENLEYSGIGRNIFSMNSAPPVASIPQPVAPARPVVQQPVYTAPVGPPPPPPINLKFFGVVTASNGQRQAFLLQGEDVFLASPGDVVARRYKVQAVNATSIVVEDLPNSNQQTLPLIMQ